MPTRKLFIIGMHRSGTSLLASWLEACGLPLGEELIGATPSNAKGHFEDLDMVEFHEKLLRYNQTDLYQGIGESLSYNVYHLAKAKSLVYLRDQLAENWAWKQPRATLFLPLWKKAAPDAHYLAPLRSPEEVVSSLYFRQYQKIGLYQKGFRKRKNQWAYKRKRDFYVDRYLSMYIRHNEEILSNFDGEMKRQIQILPIHKIVERDMDLFEHLTVNWGFPLEYRPLNSLFEPKIFGKNTVQVDTSPFWHRAKAVYSKLLSWVSVPQTST